jgi:hypothetical protein
VQNSRIPFSGEGHAGETERANAEPQCVPRVHLAEPGAMRTAGIGASLSLDAGATNDEVGKVGWRAGIHGHLPEDNTCVPRADVHWTRPKPPQWTLSRHSVRPTAKQTGIFACCRIYPAPPVAGVPECTPIAWPAVE